MNIAGFPARVHLQWFADNVDKVDTASPAPAPQAPASSNATTPPAASWRDGLPENLRDSPSLSKFDNVGKLGQSYVELQSMIGKSITPPGKDAKPEDWDRFYSRLGRPKVAEDYSFDPVEGFEADPSFMGKLKATFHSAGMTPAQAKHVFGLLAEESTASQSTARERNAQVVAAAESELRQEWGTNYDTNVALAARFADEVGGKDAVKRLEDMGIASDPLILKLLSRAGQATNGRPLVKGSSAQGKSSPYGYMNEGRKKPD
jgi:hypothetical protein